MKVVGIIGASALRDIPFVENLIAALRIDGASVSTIKRAPDGFDMDQPGKSSFARRDAGCHEVMLVADKRFVLMQEFRERTAPTLDDLVARLDPVDLVLAEGFQNAAVPTIEVHVPASGKPPRWPRNTNVIAIVCDEPVSASLPRFVAADAAGLAGFVAAHVALPPRA